MLKIMNSVENDTNHDADSCNTTYTSVDNYTEDAADANLDDVYSGYSYKNFVDLKLTQ